MPVAFPTRKGRIMSLKSLGLPKRSESACRRSLQPLSPIQNNSDLAQGPQGYSGGYCSPAQIGHVSNLRRRLPTWTGKTKRLMPRSTLGSGKLEDRTMSTSDEVQKRNAFAACAAFRIEGLEASLDRAREIAFQGELDAVGHHIEEAQGYLAQIRLLHQEALAVC